MQQLAERQGIHAAESAAQIAGLSSQLDFLRAENGEVSESAKEQEKARADEAKNALKKLSDVHQAELTAVKRQLLGLEDRCQSLMNERGNLQKQLKSSRNEHDTALRAAKTAAAAAAAGVSEEAAVAAALSAAAGAGAGAPPPARRVNSRWSDQDAAGTLRARGSRSPSPRARRSAGLGGLGFGASPGDIPEDSATPNATARTLSGDPPGSVPVARDAIESTGASLPVPAPSAIAISPLKAQASAASVDSASGMLSVADTTGAAESAVAAAAGLMVGTQPLTAAALEEREEASVPPPLTIDLPQLQINTSAQADMSDPENVNIAQQVCFLVLLLFLSSVCCNH